MVNDVELGMATAFIVWYADRLFLITNWHVVTGKNAETGVLQCKQQPTRIKVFYRLKTNTDEVVWIEKIEELYNSNGETFILHPAHENNDLGNIRIDVVAIPIFETDNLEYFPIRLKKDLIKPHLKPTEHISVIGFPHGQAVNGMLPIWKTGHLAHDFYINYLGKPVFLIDVTTKPSMSGSPAVSKIINQFERTDEPELVLVRDTDTFLGVYSGRTSPRSDLGMVWRKEIIFEMLDFFLAKGVIDWSNTWGKWDSIQSKDSLEKGTGPE